MTFEASRSKQVLILQPRGKPLYEDGKPSFGLKMLENMGWKKGNGLGKNQQGNLDFIQVRYKNNSSGIGFDRLKDNQWTDTEHNFNALLQNLNSNSNSNSNDEGSNDGTKTKSSVKSLEEMSKQSRARVHYKKFTKGKDVYKYSEKDLANIFGKKSLNESEKVAIEVVESEEEKPDQYQSNLIVNTGISITDYFKQKRKRDEVTDEVPEKPKKKKIKSNDEEIVEVADNEEIKPKKKKKSEAVEVPLEVTEEPSVSEDVKPKKKKSKLKNLEDEQKLPELNDKKKKKRKEIEVTDEHQEIDQGQETQEVEEKSKKKKPKITKAAIEEVKEIQEVQAPQKSTEPERLRGANAIYSTDVIQIPAYVAQKMAKMTVNKFSKSNLGDVVGYGMSEEIEIKVIQTKLGDTSLSTDKYSIYNMDHVVKTRVNPRKILSKIKKTKKSIQLI